MDLIDRYLVAVRRHLPEPQQKDIAEELADSLRSEAETAEYRLGRPLTPTEQEQLLQAHGHPWLMASRYLPQQHLIGPALYPYYRQATTMVVFWVVLPLTLVGGALAAIYAQNAWQAWARAMGAAWNGAIYAVGFITIVFAVLENQRVRITALDNWKASTLPEPQAGRAVPRSESLFNLICTITFLMLWIDVIRLPDIAEWRSTPVRFVPDAVWSAVYLPTLLSVLVTIATSLVDLMRPWRTLLFSVIKAVNAFAFAAIVVTVLRARHWIAVVADPSLADRVTRADYWINQTIEWTLVIVLIGTLFEALNEMWRWFKSRRENAA